MIYGSVCTGIAGDEVAVKAAGLDWQAKWFAEIEPFCAALLSHYYPEVPNLGDMTTIGEANGPIDLLVGGTPCQSFSVAGERGGLSDPRGNLALEFLRIARATRARWIVWENVPGVLSSFSGPEKSEAGAEWEETSDFATFLGFLSQCGYGWAYRIINSEFFGSAQHRRRLLVVGYLGDWRPAAAVLFERESLRRNPASRRKAGSEVAGTLGGGSGQRGWCNDLDRSGAFDRHEGAAGEIVAALTSTGVGTCGADDNQAQAGHLLPCLGFGSKDSGADVRVNKSPCVRAGNFTRSHANAGVPPAVVYAAALPRRAAGSQLELGDEQAFTLRAGEGGASRNFVVAPDVARAVTASAGHHGHSSPRGDGTGNLAVTQAGGGSHQGGQNNTPCVCVPVNNFGVQQTARCLSTSNQRIDGDTETTNVSVSPSIPIQEPGARTGKSTSDSSCGLGDAEPGDPMYTLQASHQHGVFDGLRVRRLTPVECERLQGFPDGYTDIPYRGKKHAPDGKRYFTLGNAFNIFLMKWLFARVDRVDKLVNQLRADDPFTELERA